MSEKRVAKFDDEKVIRIAEEVVEMLKKKFEEIEQKDTRTKVNNKSFDKYKFIDKIRIDDDISKWKE